MVGDKRPVIQRVAGDLGRLAQKDGSGGNIRGPGKLGLEHRARLDQRLALIVEGDRIGHPYPLFFLPGYRSTQSTTFGPMECWQRGSRFMPFGIAYSYRQGQSK